MGLRKDGYDLVLHNTIGPGVNSTALCATSRHLVRQGVDNAWSSTLDELAFLLLIILSSKALDS